MMAPAISGRLTVPAIGPLDVRIALIDTSMQDLLAISLAETLVPAVDGEADFTLAVPDALITAGRDYLLTASATAAGGTVPRAGTVSAHPWTPQDHGPQRVVLRAY